MDYEFMEFETLFNDLDYKKNDEINIDNYYKFSLDEIDNIEDRVLKAEILKLYRDDLKLLKANHFIDVNSSKSIELMYEELDKYYYNNQSEIFWPNDIVRLYPRIRHFISNKSRLCYLDSEVIEAGQAYSVYRPLLHNITKQKSFVLTKEIIIKDSCQHYLPLNIRELELMYINMHEFNIGVQDENLFPNNHPANLNQVSYQEMNHNIGNFAFKELRR